MKSESLRLLGAYDVPGLSYVTVIHLLVTTNLYGWY